MEPFQSYFQDYLSAIREASDKGASHDYLRQVFIEFARKSQEESEVVWGKSEVKVDSQTLAAGQALPTNTFDDMLIGVAKGSYFNEFLSKIEEDYTGLLRQIC